MNYLKLRIEIEDRIDEKLEDEIYSFNAYEDKAEDIQKRFIEDHFDIIIPDALEAIESEETDKGQEVYDKIVKSDSFLDRIETKLRNYFEHFVK